QFPKSCWLAGNRECAEKLCRSIAQQNCPKAQTIPRLPLSNRTSSARNGSHHSGYALTKPVYPRERLHPHPLRRHIVLNVILLKKRNDLRNICSNPNVQKLMLCNLSPLICHFWLKA